MRCQGSGVRCQASGVGGQGPVLSWQPRDYARDRQNNLAIGARRRPKFAIRNPKSKIIEPYALRSEPCATYFLFRRPKYRK